MNGKIVGGLIVLIGAVAGIAMYWLQVYAFYEEVAFEPGTEIRLTLIEGGVAEPIIAEEVTGIDSDSSPIRFRACFRTPMTQAMLTETYRMYPEAVPNVAPGWFDCFDAQAIGAALEKGEAIAFLSEANIHPGVDRVVAVFPDGRAFAWHQLNACGETAFSGRSGAGDCAPASTSP
ncbi:MAG: histidine kinase [Rhodobacteraceae bacterium]|nr:histidine kinase [Paracoccaceae bacterium]